MTLKYKIIHLLLPILLIGLGALGMRQHQKLAPKPKADAKTDLISCPPQKACAPCPSKIPATLFSPAVVFDPPGLFSQEEKTKLYNLLINPFLDYYNENETQYIAMLIKKYKPQESHLDYDYEVLAIHKNSGTQGFLYSSKQFWFPDCMRGPCSFSPSYQAKYPEVVRLNNSSL